MDNVFGIFFLILGLFITLFQLFKIFIFYKGTAEGKLLDYQEKRERTADGWETYYKHTIVYLVNGKSYIYQQKAMHSNINLKNKNIVIKYNLKNPQKSRIKGDYGNLGLGIILVLLSLMYFYSKYA